MHADADLRGLVLTGGRGTRLRPFTYTGAKQLIPIANKPIVFYALEALVEAGVRDIGIVTGDTASQIEEALGDGSRFGARFTYIPQAAPLGISHAVVTARDFLRDAPFVLFLGDNFLRGGIKRHVEAFRAARPDAQVLLKPVPNPRELGLAVLDANGRPARLLEKPANPPGNLAVIGIYLFGPRFFEAADQIAPSARGELEITDAIQKLIDGGADVRATHLTEDWIDTGRPDDLLAANRLLLGDLTACSEGASVEGSTLLGRVVIQPGARVLDSRIDGPAIIGERTEVISSRIGPHTSVYHDSSLHAADIAESIVLERTLIEESGPFRRSLIGRDVVIRGLQADRAVSLALGDHSRIEAS